MRWIGDAATQLGIPFCGGVTELLACGLSDNAHWKGTVDGFGVLHYTDRRFTRRALRNFLMLAVRRARLSDPEFLNSPDLAYIHLWHDNVSASRLAASIGVRLPARLSMIDRLQCQALARKAGAALSSRPAIYRWANDV